jgi:hypothetical protein
MRNSMSRFGTERQQGPKLSDSFFITASLHKPDFTLGRSAFVTT